MDQLSTLLFTQALIDIVIFALFILVWWRLIADENRRINQEKVHSHFAAEIVKCLLEKSSKKRVAKREKARKK